MWAADACPLKNLTPDPFPTREGAPEIVIAAKAVDDSRVFPAKAGIHLGFPLSASERGRGEVKLLGELR